MKRRAFLAGAMVGPGVLAGCAGLGVRPPAVGTGDLGVIIQRAKGRLSLVNTSSRQLLGSGSFTTAQGAGLQLLSQVVHHDLHGLGIRLEGGRSRGELTGQNAHGCQ